jgi:hypothetical protein
MIGVLGFDSWQGLGIFLFSTASRMALGLTQPPIQWVAGALSQGVKQLGHEADHSPPCSAEVKVRVALYLHSPNMSSWHGAQLNHGSSFGKIEMPQCLQSSWSFPVVKPQLCRKGNTCVKMLYYGSWPQQQRWCCL